MWRRRAKLNALRPWATQAATTARYSHLDADPMRHAADIIGNQIAAALAGNSAEVIQHPAMKSRL